MFVSRSWMGVATLHFGFHYDFSAQYIIATPPHGLAWSTVDHSRRGCPVEYSALPSA